jgi:endonuclease/exonuclease/phosphatase family metal-dependent hydrolase
MRVATFNIKNGLDLDTQRTDNRGLVAACRRLDADVLALEEVDRRRVRSRWRRQSRLVARRTGAQEVFGRTRRRDVLGSYGNALIVRGTMRDVELWPLPTTPGHEQRGAILARVSAGGIECSVAACHLQNRREEWTVHEAPEQLRAVLAALRTRPAPRLLMGDFNLRERVAGPIVAEAGFTAVEHDLTWPAPAPEISIDWICLDGLEATNVEVVHLPVSDHRAVVADLRLPS